MADLTRSRHMLCLPGVLACTAPLWIRLHQQRVKSAKAGHIRHRGTCCTNSGSSPPRRVNSAKTIAVRRRCRLQTWFLACSSRCDRGRWPFIHQMSVQSAAQTARTAR